MITYVKLNLSPINKICDKVPLVSTGTSLINLFLKAVRPILPSSFQKSYLFTYIQTRSWTRSLILLVPLLGNIIIALYDFTQSRKAEALYKATKLDHPEVLFNRGHTYMLKANQEEKKHLAQVQENLKFGIPPAPPIFDYPKSLVKKGLNLLYKAALLDHKKSIEQLCFYYFTQKKNFGSKSLEVSQRGAHLNIPIALHLLAHHYLEGKGVAQNDATAFNLLEKSANLDFSPSLNDLAGCYEKGVGVKANPQMARSLWEKGANRGYPESMNNFAGCLDEGYGGPQDINKAVFYWSEGAKKGHPGCLNNLAFCFDQGRGVQKDQKIAAQLWAQASQRGHVEATENLATCYELGDGVPKNKGFSRLLRGEAIQLNPALTNEEKFAQAAHNLRS